MKPYFLRVAEQSPTMFWINNPTQPQVDLSIEEFEDFGPVQLFKSAFTKSWRRVLNIIQERRIQIDPKPKGDPALIG